MSEEREDRKPVWAVIVLIVLGLFDFFIGMGLNTESTRSYFNQIGVETLASFVLFCQVIGLLAAGIILVAINLPRRYSSKGRSIDTSHQWVNARTGSRYGDASVRDVYEHQHGSGSWERKVERERKSLQVIYVIIAVGLIIFGANALFQSSRFPILIQTRALIKSDVLFWISCIGFTLAGCFSIFMVIFVFWDLVAAVISGSFTMDGRPQAPKYKSPSFLKLLWRLLLFIAVVLLQIYLSIVLVFPGLSGMQFGSAYPTLLSVLYYAAGILFMMGAFYSQPEYDSEYLDQMEREQEAKSKKDALDYIFQRLVGEETPLQERYMYAQALLKERDSLTSQGKNRVVEVLKILTGEDFGEDYQSWITWLKARIQ